MLRRMSALVLAGSIFACTKSPPPEPEVFAEAPFIRSLPALKSGTSSGVASMSIVVSKTNIALDTLILAPLPSQETWATGIDAQYKRNGKSDLYIVPLGNAANERSLARTDGGNTTIDATILCDGDVPFRILVEILFTLGQSKVTEFHFVAPSGAAAAKKNDLAQIDVHPPRAPKKLTTQPDLRSLLIDAGGSGEPLIATQENAGLHPSVTIVKEGFSVSGAGSNIGPGCKEPGTGIAVPNAAGGAHDFNALGDCLARLKAKSADYAKEREITVAAASNVTYRDFLMTVDSVRGARADVFPDVLIGVPR